MRLKSALRRGVAAAVIAGIVVSSGIPAYAGTWNIADGDITVKAGDAEGPNNVKQGDNDFVKDEGDTVITGESKEHTVTIDTSGGDVDVTFDDLKIDVSGKKEGNGSDDSPVRESNAAVTVQGDHDATIELDGKNELKSGSYNAGLEKNGHESEGTLTIKDDKGKDGSLTAEGGDNGGAGIGGGKESTGSNITIRGGTVEAVGGSSAAGIGDGAGRASDDTDDPNPGKLYICGDAEVTAKAGSQMMTDAKAPAIGGTYGEVPTESLSDDEHKVTGGRLTRLNADGTVMEGMGYDYTSTPTPQPDEDDDDDDVPPPAQENAPEPLPGGMVVKGFFASRVTIQRLDLSGVTESGTDPMVGGVKASDAGEVLAPRSTVTTDIPSLREDGVEDIFFRYQDTMTHYSVEKMADAAGEDADVELKQNREDISLRLDGETRDDLSERYLEWVPVQTPEPQEWLILTHELAKKRDDLPSLDWWLEPEREETPGIGHDESLKQELDMMDFQLAKKRDDLPSLGWWLEPARTETPRIGLEESLKQLASRFEAIAPEEDKPRLFLLETTVPDGTKYTNLLESDLRSYADLGDDWEDLPDTQGEIKLWLPPEDLEKAKLWMPEDLGHLISPSKESLSGIDGIA